MSITLFYQRPIHSTLYLLLSILFTDKLVRYILFKFHSYFNQHKVNVIEAFLMPFITLLSSLFINIKQHKISFEFTLYDYYPHLRLPYRTYIYSNILRFIIQSVFLVFFKNQLKSSSVKEDAVNYFYDGVSYLLRQLRWFDLKLGKLLKRLLSKNKKGPKKSAFKAMADARVWQNKLVKYVILAFILFLLAIFITIPFSLEAQAVFISFILLVAYALKRVKGQMATIVMITLSVTTSSRYLWWRYTETLNWDDPLALALGGGLLLAETYAWLVLILGFFQTVNPLERKPVPLPKDTDLWPTVDVYIPTYNEPLSVVRPTTLAALSIDWPADKLNVYILDDGKRSEFKDFAAEIGVGYLARSDNNHAKAGNMNSAMRYTDGEYIAIFDCDHVPARSFLQMTMGQFLKDSKVCLVQTPHHFFSADPFERNLNNHSQIPNENMLFYGLIQDGNDMWDATFFCGSCAVLKREALDNIGGFAFETVTEDAHTALRMQRAGYKTAYINIPQAAGLATDSLSAHIGQRIRWARGMAQIFRLDNPLMGKGLSIPQRLCYINAMLHFLSGIPRIVFLTAPLALIYFNAYIIYAPFIAIFIYVVPTLIQIKATNSRIQGKYRYSFWGEVYESVLAWYILKPTTVALFNPNKGKFNVTEKGGLNDEEHYDWGISKPYLILLLINLLGIIVGVLRLFLGDSSQIGVLIISMGWAFYNIIILGAAVAVAAEARQVRHSHRIKANFPAGVRLANGHTLKVKITDYSDNGVGIETEHAHLCRVNDKIELLMSRGNKQFSFTTYVCNTRKKQIGLTLKDLSLEKQRAFIQCTFSRADAWLDWQNNFRHDRPSYSFKEVQKTSLRGFSNLLFHAPRALQPIIKFMTNTVIYINSFTPKKPIVHNNYD
ncbi:UDP-forming cellulose synthase catalytic subunit [Pseudoalteromonas arctica]|uniref:Cellulose synthase catalytic subunit [UDP-forming] n=1 Tax=Pseudoalteromonas arctica TaxID=394751 RepID=A0AAP7CKY4_9GAMM|nr:MULTISPECIES: UDP-forming cellulose synthase catalytic subunit [Pseudoalteromonas]MBG9998182.1 UDP-forming cellulose synthase catalytic subunit [Pseudoalteromonas sp. NSLLW24]MBH0016878.1 UDP-forming cellulose synthase catalytic subunit [Pseudoalteromonas sp. NGC95]MBH0034331.1 UDP-forming cellulose synthase catalytic subunit [Pseudoalteromonas sp. NZS71_1]NMP01896.1 UDP-forming cellulose synthase catalytic subunit [Pseudoalteromonas arctica]NMP78857.1 UDP-forming cellulose synthase catalyt